MAGKELTLVGAKTRRLQKRAKRDWSMAKARAFLSVLAETCNVSEACRQSGVSMTVAYRRQRMDASFRAAWVEAIGVAYSRLELMLLNRAFNGSEKLFTRRDGTTERMLEYPNGMALRLLQLHRETAIEANHEVPPEDVAELREKLVRKLQRMRRRDEEQEAQGAELRCDAARDGAAEGGAGGDPA